MQDLDRINERAYALWEKAGKPDGAHDEHWQQACREMESDDGEAMAGQEAVPSMPTINGASQKAKAL